MSAAPRILVARETAQITYGKKGLERVIVHKGVTRVREGHPMLRGHADLFEPLTAHFELDGAVDDEPFEVEPCPECAARAEAADDVEPPADDEPTSDEDKPAEPPADAPVETVTANPGEKRVTKPRAPRVKRS